MKRLRLVPEAVLLLAAIGFAFDARAQTCFDYLNVQETNTCGLQSRLVYCDDPQCSHPIETRYGIRRQHDSTAPSISWSFHSPAIAPNLGLVAAPDSSFVAFENAMADWQTASRCIPRDRASALSGSDFLLTFVQISEMHDLDAFRSFTAPDNELAVTANYPSSAGGTHTDGDPNSCYIITTSIFLLLNRADSSPERGTFPLTWGHAATNGAQCYPNCGDEIDVRSTIEHEYGHALGIDENDDPDCNTMCRRGQSHYGLAPCEAGFARLIYPDLADCDQHPDAFVNNFGVRETAGGGAAVSWSCAYELGTGAFLLDEAPSRVGPWSGLTAIQPDSSREYAINVAYPAGPFFRLREAEVSGDTLMCMMDSLMVPVQSRVEPSSVVVDSIGARLGALFPTSSQAVGVEPDASTQWVCIVPDSWVTSAQPLAQYWNNQGVVARLMPLSHIPRSVLPPFPAEPMTDAIWNYLRGLWNGGLGNIRYVLLMGDGYYDGFNDATLIPTWSHSSGDAIFTPYYVTDWDYVEFTGDRSPEAAIGRAPVRSAADVTLFVDKTLRAAGSIASDVPHDNVGVWMWEHDNGTRRGARALSNGLLLEQPLPSRVTVRELEDTPDAPLTDAGRRAVTVAAMEEGRSVVAITGTASQNNNWDFWLQSASFNWSSSAPNWALHPFILGLSCDLGDVDVPWTGRPLLESGILEPGRGPWGGFGPSRAALMDGSRMLGQKFVTGVFGTDLTTRIGDVARVAVGAAGLEWPEYRETFWRFMLIGDPCVLMSNGSIVNPVTAVVTGPSELAVGGSGQFVASPAGGDGLYSYQWFVRNVGSTGWGSSVAGAASFILGGSAVNREVRCVVHSAGTSWESIRCLGSSSQPATTTLTVQGLAIVSPGVALVDPGDEPSFVATATDRTCRIHAYEWRSRAEGGTTWSSIVSTSPSYQVPTPMVNGIDLLVTATTEAQGLSQVIQVRFRTGGDGGGGCPTVEVKGSSGWITENTILGRSPSGAALLDDYRIRSAPDTADGVVAVRIRENEQEYTTLDQVRLIAVDHSIDSRAYAAGERVLLGLPQAAARVTKSTGEDVTAQLSGAGYYAGQPGDTLLVEMGSSPSTGTASLLANNSPNATDTGGGGGDVIDDGGGKGAQPGVGQLRGPTPSGPDVTDAMVLGTSGIIVQAPSAQGDWDTVLHYYPRERPDGAVLDTIGYDRLRLIFVGQHNVRFIGRLIRSNEQLSAAKLPLLAASHSRYGDVSQAVSALGNLMTDLAPGDTVSLSFRNVALAESKTRDLFLFTNGVYTSNLPAGAHPARPVLPTRFALRQNQPNPFSTTTLIRFDLPMPSPVRLEVFDLQGRLVKTLANGPFNAGSFSLAWDHRTDSGVSVRPGIYLYRINAAGHQAQAKMLLMP